MMDDMMMSNNRRTRSNRIFIPFSNFGFGGMSGMGGIDEMFQQMLQMLSKN